jgi:hypothetical protein
MAGKRQILEDKIFRQQREREARGGKRKCKEKTAAKRRSAGMGS